MVCAHIPERSHREFSLNLWQKAEGGECIPYGGTLELTFRCNLRCVHCYCNLPLNDREAKAKELSYKEICHILDGISEAGCLWLLLTGGEVLIREDFWDIYIYAKKKGFIIEVFTNGTLITPSLAQRFREYPPFDIEITLYGITKETHEDVTGVPGSFEKTISGIHYLLEKKIPLTLKTIVMTLNKYEFPQLEKYVQRLGTRFRFDPFLIPRLDGSKKPCQFRLTPEEVVELELENEGRRKELKEFFEEFWGHRYEYLYLCGAGLTSFNINPYGEVSPCNMVLYPRYDLRKTNFRQGWLEMMPRFRAQRPAAGYKCQTCKMVALCEQCPAWAGIENGDEQSIVEFLCSCSKLKEKIWEGRGEDEK